MTTINLEEVKEKIENRINNISKEIVRLADLTRPISPDSAIGRISRMDAINNKSVNEAALRLKKKQLIALNNALKNIYNDSFGLCIKCHTQIPLGRIMIMPESNKCVRCASL